MVRGVIPENSIVKDKNTIIRKEIKMARLFGTDGVRGVAGTELTSLLAMNIGIALAYILKRNNENVKVLVGNDTRISKDMIVNSISAGLSSKGVTVVKQVLFQHQQFHI